MDQHSISGAVSLKERGTMAPKTGEFTEDEKWLLRELLHCLDVFADVKPTFQLQAMRAFLLVAIEEGLGATEYSRKAGLPQSVMSRHLLDIGERDRYMEPGLGLVDDKVDPMELRKHIKTLTSKGHGLAHKLVRLLSPRVRGR
jgi:hypothetical protein